MCFVVVLCCLSCLFLCCVVLCCDDLYCVIVLSSVVLCCVVLCCVVLCCVVLCCVVLCHVVSCDDDYNDFKKSEKELRSLSLSICPGNQTQNHKQYSERSYPPT
jgi:hypothetical protein